MKSAISFVAGAIVTAGLLSAVALFAQDNPLSLLHPLVIDITQSVPVMADVALDTEDGVITSTLPLTVDVALRVSIAGPLSVTVAGAAAPIVTVATAEPAPATDEPIFQDVRWSIAQVNDIGQNWEYNNSLRFETTGKFLLLDIELENTGKKPVEIDYGDRTDLQVELIDDQERSFAPYDTGYQLDDLCEYAAVNPGLITPCFIPFEVPEDAAGLKLRLTLQSESESKVAELTVNLE